jgi:soluble P-type ATPase
MIELTIPGFGALALQYLVADFNGTLAMDGALLPGVADALRGLADRLDIHVVTADTFGTARGALAALPVCVVVLPAGQQDEGKRQYIASLGADRCVAIGNGLNDRLLLQAAALGIAVVQGEGASAQTLQSADVVAPEIGVALGLLMHPSRLIATLRR